MTPQTDATDLSGLVAVVTGAAAGLGRAEAIGLARAGATIVVNDIAGALDRSDVIDEITSAGAKAKEGEGTLYGRIINTSSEAGLAGPVGQANYGAAKAGITALTLTAARALERYGVRANAIAPRARTAMTADVFGESPELVEGQIDPLSPEHVVNLVRFLASPASQDVNGQLFIVYGPTVTLVAAPTAEHRFSAASDAWDASELSETLQNYFADRDPELNFSATALMSQGE